MPQDIFFFVYHMWNGRVHSQTWWGEVTVQGKPMDTLAKFRITEDEFRLSISELEAKYPYSG